MKKAVSVPCLLAQPAWGSSDSNGVSDSVLLVQQPKELLFRAKRCAGLGEGAAPFAITVFDTLPCNYF